MLYEVITAVGVGSMIFNFIYWNFGFLRMGTTGITAQYFGKEDESEQLYTFGRALLAGFLIALGLFVFQRSYNFV